MKCSYCGETLWNNDDATEHAGICPKMMLEPDDGNTSRIEPVRQNTDSEIYNDAYCLN